MLSFIQYLTESGATLPDKHGYYTLYHGTSHGNASRLAKHGWKPGEHSSGSQGGESKYLYLTNHPENAAWYAGKKGGGKVLQVKVHKDHIKVDPHDGVSDSVHGELNLNHKLPGSVAAHTKHIAPQHFTHHSNVDQDTSEDFD